MKTFFQFESNNTNVKTEVIAGVTTFLATLYIIVVNPAILSSIPGMSFASVLTATVLVSAFSSIAMGLYAKNPIVIAPGMGINAFFALVLSGLILFGSCLSFFQLNNFSWSFQPFFKGFSNMLKSQTFQIPFRCVRILVPEDGLDMA